MRALLQGWLGWLMVERAASPHTLAAYRRDVGLFVDFCAALGIGAISALTVGAIRTHLHELSGRLASRSCARHLWSIRSFLDYARMVGALEADLGELIDAPAIPKKLPHTLSPAQVERLIEAAAGRQSKQYGDAREVRLAMRDSAILETLYATGARSRELARIRLDDVNLAAGWVRLFGKGAKERIVPIGRLAREAIEKYLKHLRPELVDPELPNAALFVSRRGQPLDGSAVYRLVRRCADAARLGEFGPHRLRHACATAMLEGGANLRVVQELLGHSSVTTTEIYTHVTAARLADVHARCHPLGRETVRANPPARRRRSRKGGRR